MEEMNTKTPYELAGEVIRVLDEKQAHDMLLYHVTDITVVTDYYVICTGRSTTHVKALADDVSERLEEKMGVAPAHVEGRSDGTWVLLDFGSVIVHIFTRDTREFYKLERLYPEATQMNFSQFLPEDAQ